jgi:multidrug efflux pump subunit AcrA (membrane-fusion protein)
MHKIGLVICLVSCLLLFSCKHAQPPPSTVVPVNLLTVTTEPVIYYEKYPSTTVALKQVDLLPEVQGYITGMFFKEGSHVKKGQRLYEIDRRTYEANYSIAVANLKVAEGNVEQTKQDADRYTYLNNNHAVAKQLYDQCYHCFQKCAKFSAGCRRVCKDRTRQPQLF